MANKPFSTRDLARYTIRPATADDAAAIARLIVSENSRPADAGQIARFLETAPSVVAALDEELVGMIYSRPFSPDILEWRNSLVASAHRRVGLGRLLVDAMEEQTRRAGYLAIIGVNCWKRPGGSRARASTARAFWRAMGWTIIFATDGSAVVAKHLSRRYVVGHNQAEPIPMEPEPTSTARPKRRKVTVIPQNGGTPSAVDEQMIRVRDLRVVGLAEPAVSALDRITATRRRRAIVSDVGTLVGIVSVAEVVRGVEVGGAVSRSQPRRSSR